MPQINTSTGAMEISSSFDEVIKGMIAHMQHSTNKMSVELVRNSKNHGGKDMIVLSTDDGDCNIYNLEISELGIFPYIFDDGAS